MPCKWVRFAYRAVPLPAWQAFWLDRHIDRCPRCQGQALAAADIRSLGVTAADLQGEPPLRPFAAVPRPSRGRSLSPGWRYAFASLVATALLVVIVAVYRLAPPVPPAQGTVTISEAEPDVRVFAVLEARVNGEPARPVVFKPGQPGMTIVWFEKAMN
jgi:hypothetical protein